MNIGEIQHTTISCDGKTVDMAIERMDITNYYWEINFNAGGRATGFASSIEQCKSDAIYVLIA